MNHADCCKTPVVCRAAGDGPFCSGLRAPVSRRPPGWSGAGDTGPRRDRAPDRSRAIELARARPRRVPLRSPTSAPLGTRGGDAQTSVEPCRSACAFRMAGRLSRVSSSAPICPYCKSRRRPVAAVRKLQRGCYLRNFSPRLILCSLLRAWMGQHRACAGGSYVRRGAQRIAEIRASARHSESISRLNKNSCNFESSAQSQCGSRAGRAAREYFRFARTKWLTQRFAGNMMLKSGCLPSASSLWRSVPALTGNKR